MIFPQWTNKVVFPFLTLLGLFLIFIVAFIWYYFSPKNTDVGYMPEQPIAFSHKLHAGELGLDCRYCHYTVEKSPHAAIPPTQVCMNCHHLVKENSKGDGREIAKVIEAYQKKKPIQWVKVHNIAEYSYFDHSAHVNAGVSCVSCHGRVDKMEVVFQAEPLSMRWCLECHREPEKFVRPKEFVTDLSWHTTNQVESAKKLIKENNIMPREDCNTCHR